MIDTQHWTETEFLAYCLAFAAMTDLQVLRQELDHIIDIVGEEKTEEAFAMVKELNDSQRLDIIHSYKEQFYPDESSKEVLLKHMHDVFLADGKYHQLEQLTMTFLRKML